MTTKRESISKRLRFAIYQRDGFTCQYCGAKSPDCLLVLDHITSVALGGTTKPGNLVTACEPCNQGKAAKALKAYPKSGSWIQPEDIDPLDYPFPMDIAPDADKQRTAWPTCMGYVDHNNILEAIDDANCRTFHQWVRERDFIGVCDAADRYSDLDEESVKLTPAEVD